MSESGSACDGHIKGLTSNNGNEVISSYPCSISTGASEINHVSCDKIENSINQNEKATNTGNSENSYANANCFYRDQNTLKKRKRILLSPFETNRIMNFPFRDGHFPFDQMKSLQKPAFELGNDIPRLSPSSFLEFEPVNNNFLLETPGNYFRNVGLESLLSPKDSTMNETSMTMKASSTESASNSSSFINSISNADRNTNNCPISNGKSDVLSNINSSSDSNSDSNNSNDNNSNRSNSISASLSNSTTTTTNTTNNNNNNNSNSHSFQMKSSEELSFQSNMHFLGGKNNAIPSQASVQQLLHVLQRLYGFQDPFGPLLFKRNPMTEGDTSNINLGPGMYSSNLGLYGSSPMSALESSPNYKLGRQPQPQPLFLPNTAYLMSQSDMAYPVKPVDNSNTSGSSQKDTESTSSISIARFPLSDRSKNELPNERNLDQNGPFTSENLDRGLSEFRTASPKASRNSTVSNRYLSQINGPASEMSNSFYQQFPSSLPSVSIPLLNSSSISSGSQLVSPSSRFVLLEQPNEIQRKSYKNENRCLLPNPLTICLVDSFEQKQLQSQRRSKIQRISNATSQIENGTVTVTLVDSEGQTLSSNKQNLLESMETALTQPLDESGSAHFSLKILDTSEGQMFRLMFTISFKLCGVPLACEEKIISRPFMVYSNRKKHVKERPFVIDLKPMQGPSNIETEVWIKGRGFSDKVNVTFGDQAGRVTETSENLVTVMAPVRFGVQSSQSETVSVVVSNKFAREHFTSERKLSFTYLPS